MTKPTHPVELLACAIATEEGFFSIGSTPERLHNPGDLRYAGQFGAEAPPFHTGVPPIATFDTLPHGVTALFRQIWLQVAAGQTVAQIVAQWAPPNENNTSVYLERVLGWTGLDANVPVLLMLPPLVQLNREAT